MSYMGYPTEVTPAVPLKYSPSLQTKLKDYLEVNNIHQSTFAKRLGRSQALLSKYLNMTPDSEPHGDVPAFERLIEDVLRASEKLRTIEIELLETEVYKDCNSAFELIRKTNDVGLVYGRAGIGKTCAIKLYIHPSRNPSTLVVDLKDKIKSSNEVQRKIYAQISTRRHSKVSTYEYLVNYLKDSNRLIIFDNAQRLRRSGLDWLFDFHDDTNCPMALVGNPDILDRIATNDQHFSRMGVCEEIRQQSGAHEIAEKMIRQRAPEFTACAQMAAEVLQCQGHLRFLEKVLTHAREMLGSDKLRASAPAEELPQTAFRLALKKLQSLREPRKRI